MVLAGEVRLNPWSLYDTKAIGCPMRRAWMKFLFWSLDAKKDFTTRYLLHARRRQPEVH